MIYDLVNRDSESLTKVCERFNFTTPQFDPVEMAHNLVETLYHYHGLGIAYNQLDIEGNPYCVFAMRGHPENFVCYNPKIVMPGEQEIVLEEGCLTYPNLFVKIKRPQHVKVRFQTPNGEMKTETFTGMTARVFQHELDHLDGIIFYNKATRYHRDQALRRWKLDARTKKVG